MTRELIDDMREVILPFVKEVLLKTNYEGLGKSDAKVFERDFNEILNLAIKALEPEPKTGHWITQWNVAHQKEYYYCSECREEYSYDGETGIKMNDYNFCPNCGCRMVEPQESEE